MPASSACLPIPRDLAECIHQGSLSTYRASGGQLGESALEECASDYVRSLCVCRPPSVRTCSFSGAGTVSYAPFCLLQTGQGSGLSDAVQKEEWETGRAEGREGRQEGAGRPGERRRGSRLTRSLSVGSLFGGTRQTGVRYSLLQQLSEADMLGQECQGEAGKPAASRTAINQHLLASWEQIAPSRSSEVQCHFHLERQALFPCRCPQGRRALEAASASA